VSEPKAVAERAEEVCPGVWYWGILDERIGNAPGSAHAVADEGGTVLIDPEPLASEAMAQLGTVAGICLTTSNHQRSSWRLRRELGVRVWAPALAREIEEEPDVRYEEGDELPAGLEAIFTPGAGTTQHSFHHAMSGVLFTPDLFMHGADGSLGMLPAEYMHDPEQARGSAEKLLQLEFSILCLGHGPPVTDDPHAAVRAALAGASPA
jgi:glyoxylase-like metal-dependent hydrolase (beta-lactamase superfamily II)